jgi:hypothetical protein
MPISNPHGQKIQALLVNSKIPDSDFPQIESLKTKVIHIRDAINLNVR